VICVEAGRGGQRGAKQALAAAHGLCRRSPATAPLTSARTTGLRSLSCRP